ncbi:BON domain-containing protein [Paractinoplanes rishiriensis]|uniref:BON domain-containing protein n=1 Tax=Paractinoplanes rishiriensis TaxID=1050105 RepID=A0A919K5F5_9ACTN|nr:BON domain-containing protein [Actinoplanes rishiriensis]GIF01176.1 hypothetical protein Ari01nite_86400 [Actinoplanes rishiriensis]
MTIMMKRPYPDDSSRSEPHQHQPDPDNALCQQVTERLRQQPDASTQAITVQAQHGVVLLGGTVTSPADRDNAANIARKINGVRDICNMVTVSAAPGDTPSSTAHGGTADARHQGAHPNRTAFDAITADLMAQDPGLARRVEVSLNPAVRITLAIVVGVAWALLSVLLVTATWLAVLIIGGLLIMATAVALRKRRPHRSGSTSRRLPSHGSS